MENACVCYTLENNLVVASDAFVHTYDGRISDAFVHTQEQMCAYDDCISERRAFVCDVPSLFTLSKIAVFLQQNK